MLNRKHVKQFVFAFLGLALALMYGQAEAALSAVIGTTLTGIQADALALVDLVWPVVGAVTGGFILFKIFKRGANKV